MKRSFLALGTILLFMNCTQPQEPATTTMFVGTYTNGDSEGIYSFQFNTTTGELSNKTMVAAMKNPSFLKLSPDNKNLYAVGETDSFDSSGGVVFAFAVGDSTLQLLNKQGSGGANPCHVAVSDDGKQIAVSNYSGGNLALFTTDADGKLNDEKQLIDHKVLDTTKTSHVHMAKFMGNSVFTADLGLDAIKRYSKEKSNYIPALQPSLDFPKGSGPRHFTFGQNGKFLYVINELTSSITVCKRNSDDEYAPIITHSTVAAEFKGESFCADIHLSEDGKFLYGSNRGENTIVVFAVNQQTKDLTLVERFPVKGDWPRNFAIDPSGNFLLVANQKSNNIAVFKRNSQDGTLGFLHELKMDSPVCLEFME